MRIAYFVGTFPNTRETFVSNEIIDLLRRGIEIDVLSWNEPTDPIIHRSVRESGVLARTHYFRYRHLLKVLFSPFFWLALWSLCTARDDGIPKGLEGKLKLAYFVTLVRRYGHTHVHSHFCHDVAMVASRLAQITFSLTVHTFVPNVITRNPAYIRSASFVAAASEYVRDGLCTLGVPGGNTKIHVVRCGIDPEVFKPGRSLCKNIDVLCVAGLGRTKGIEYLIQATSIVKARYRKITVAIVGGESKQYPDYPVFLREELERCGVQDEVHLLGPKSNEEVLELLEQSLVFALPCVELETTADNIPVALMEAAAMQLPTISTPVSGIPELVIDGVTGVLVPQRDAPALAQAIVALLQDDGLRHRLGVAARKRIEEEFCRKISGARLHSLFEQCANTH